MSAVERSSRCSEKLLRRWWFGGRRRRPAMAGIATHVTLSIRKFGVDLARHRQHHARRLLLGIVIAREITLHVAVRALHAQRGSERTHRHDDLLTRLARQNLQIFRRTPGAFFPFLGVEAQRNKQQYYR